MREHLSKNYSKSSFWSDLDYDFSNAHFFYPVNFNDSYFGASLNFFGATFTERADFSGAKFTGYASFSGAIFHSEPSFTDVLGKVRFSHKVAPESYSFGVDPYSPCKIEIEEQEYNGVKFRIPKGAILFDPDGSSEQKDDNDS